MTPSVRILRREPAREPITATVTSTWLSVTAMPEGGSRFSRFGGWRVLIALLFPGRRVYVLGYRVHHGHTGLAILTAGVVLGSRRLIALGALLCADDAWDWRHWCRPPVHRRYEA